MNKGKGFTIIEMMIVICIIAILAAVVIPAFQSDAALTGRKQAQQTQSAPAQMNQTEVR